MIEVHGVYQQEKEGINTFICAVSLYVAETAKTSTKEHESPLPIKAFGIVVYSFVGQPFSKQLYIVSSVASQRMAFLIER